MGESPDIPSLDLEAYAAEDVEVLDWDGLSIKPV
jgi:hypothetical protein